MSSTKSFNIPSPKQKSITENFVYLVSDELDYRLLICADAGPQYAINFGWQYDNISRAGEYLRKGYTLVFDTRLSVLGYEAVYQLVANNPDSEFIGTVTDPYYEECIDKPLYKFLFKTTNLSNIRYLTQYQPTEIIAFLRNIKGPHSMLVLNYPYLKSKEVQKPFRVFHKFQVTA